MLNPRCSTQCSRNLIHRDVIDLDDFASTRMTGDYTHARLRDVESLGDEFNERRIRRAVDRRRGESNPDRVVVPACDRGLRRTRLHVDVDAN